MPGPIRCPRPHCGGVLAYDRTTEEVRCLSCGRELTDVRRKPGIRLCTACTGRGWVAVTDVPPRTMMCPRCHGTGREPPELRISPEMGSS